MLTTYLWIRQVWYDAYLKWDKEEYDNLEMINIPSDLVWKPDIVLYNKSVIGRRAKKSNYVDKDFHSLPEMEQLLHKRVKHVLF